MGYSPQGHKELDTTEATEHAHVILCTGERNGNPLQYYCLENSVDRGPPSGDLPKPWIEPTSPVAPALQADSLPLNHWGSLCLIITCGKKERKGRGKKKL